MDDLQSMRSLRDIMGDVATDAQELVRGEVSLARAELDQKLDHALLGLVRVFGGMFVAFAGVVVLLLAAAAALSIVIPAWAALLIVGLIIAGVGAFLTREGISYLSLGGLTPVRTVRNVQADAEIVKGHI